jgi:hypothetical protein
LSETQWEFTTFGNRVIAVNGFDVPQSYIMGTDTDFSNLTAPAAKHVATVRGFVFLGNLTGFTNRIHWSALEGPTDFVVNPAVTQSDFNDMFGEFNIGQVQKIVGGEYATIFMENGIFLGTYVGGDLIFRFDQIVSGIGTPAPGSVISYGGKIFFLGNDGFYILAGSSLIPIGADIINRYFFDDVNKSDIWRISATIDPVNTLYIVGYPTQKGKINRLLIYNWTAKKWSVVRPGDLECLFTFYSESGTLESLSSLIGNPDTGAYADVSVDTTLFIGGQASLAAINDNHKAVLMNGDALEATIATGEVQLSPGKTLVTEVTPYVEGEAVTRIQIGYRNNLAEQVEFTASKLVGSEGKAYLFNTARYQRARIRVSGEWEKAYGVDWKAQPAGEY